MLLERLLWNCTVACVARVKIQKWHLALSCGLWKHGMWMRRGRVDEEIWMWNGDDIRRRCSRATAACWLCSWSAHCIKVKGSLARFINLNTYLTNLAKRIPIELKCWTGNNCWPEWLHRASPMCPPCSTGPTPRLPSWKSPLIPLPFASLYVLHIPIMLATFVPFVASWLSSLPFWLYLLSLFRPLSFRERESNWIHIYGFIFLTFGWAWLSPKLSLSSQFAGYPFVNWWLHVAASKWWFLIGLRGSSTSFPNESSCLQLQPPQQRWTGAFRHHIIFSSNTFIASSTSTWKLADINITQRNSLKLLEYPTYLDPTF